MDIYCTNTAQGLVPHGDDNYEKKQKLKIGKVYKCKITMPRDYQKHKRYFALINCAWEYQSGERQEKLFHNNVELFRKTVEITAGFADTIWSVKRKEFIEIPKSISFSNMDDLEFQDLYLVS